MTSRRRRRLVGAVVGTLVGFLVGVTLIPVGQAQAIEAPAEDDPLVVTLDSLAPGAIPARGPIVLRGTVTNRSESTWSQLQVFGLSSPAPLTTRAELREAVALDPLVSVGDRLTDAGQFVDLPGELAPGETASYRLRLTRADLQITGDPGVYWLGVQILGTADGVRTDGADGRVRVLAPLMPERRPRTTQLSLTLPLRAPIGYDSLGRVIGDEGWAELLSSQGRLGRLLSFSDAADGFGLSWILDPALLDVARALRSGNAGYAIGTREPTDDPAEPSNAPSDEASAATAGEESDGDDAPADTPGATEADEFLTAIDDQAANRDVWQLPYADIDLDGVVGAGGLELAAAAFGRAAEISERLGIADQRVVAPLDGRISAAALEALDPGVAILLDPEATRLSASRLDLTTEGRAVVQESAADLLRLSEEQVVDTSPLALRQRILAVASVHALSPQGDQPLAITLPDDWDPGPQADDDAFWDELDQPWLDGITLSDLVATPAPQTVSTTSEALIPPAEGDADDGIGATQVSAARDLIAAGSTLDDLLTERDTLPAETLTYALSGLSSQVADVSVGAAARTQSITRALETLMNRITITGPSFVTMTGEGGPFQVTVTNGLDEPVAVGVDARINTGDPLSIAPAEALPIPPGGRLPVRLEANTDQIGIWEVDLRSVTPAGDPLGPSAEMRIRSSQIGAYVWSVIGVGGVVLAVLLIVRIRRKLRVRRSSYGPRLERVDP